MAQEANQSQGRQNVISYDKYFMGIAFWARQRSKDPEYQVGACIINEYKKIVSVGYNGMPSGCLDLPWGKHAKSALDKKNFFVCHAELNAIIFKNTVDLKGCTMYTTLHPCNECAKLIIQSGIAKVIYFSDEKGHKDEFKAARKMFDMEPEIVLEQYTGNRDTVELKFSTENLSA